MCGVVSHSVCAADTQYTTWVMYKGRGFYSAHKLRATNYKQHSQASGEEFRGCIIAWSLRAGRRSTCVGKEQGFDEGPGQTALLGPLLLGLVHSSEIVHSWLWNPEIYLACPPLALSPATQGTELPVMQFEDALTLYSTHNLRVL